MSEKRTVQVMRVFLSAWLGAVLSSGAQPATEPLKPVTLQLKWEHQFQFAGYYVAKELGYYREAGLDVDIVPGGPSLDVTEAVLSGRADFGVGTSGLLLDYAMGKPVVVLGVIYQHSPLALIMRADTPSTTMEDLLGQSIMMEAQSADLLAMFRRGGLPLDSLTLLGHSGVANDLFRQDVDAISAYLTDEPYALDQLGVPYFILSPRSYGIDFYGDNFFTRRELMESDEEGVLRFREATLRGWQKALQEPEMAVDLILEKYTQRKSRAHLLYEARGTRDLMTQLVTPGYMLPGRWEHIAETYIEVGMLEEVPDLSGFIFEMIPEGRGMLKEVPVWVWQVVFLTMSLLAFFVIVSMHFHNLSRVLRLEITKREETETQLIATNEALTLAKEDAEEACRKKTWFVANVSHDLRAPISSVVGLCNIFKHHSKSLDLPDKFDTFLDQLHSGSEFLMMMLNNILDVSSAEMDSAAVRPEAIALDDWTTSIANLVQPLADERNISIRVESSPVGSVVQADRTRLSQILLNLIQNAIKFSPSNGIVAVDIAAQLEQLELTVRDNGPGVSPEEQEQLFELFAQGTKGPSLRSGGGLGLSIVDRNARLLGGAVKISDAQPSGAVFSVTIPLSQEIIVNSREDMSSQG